jgi:hypothetical protein
MTTEKTDALARRLNTRKRWMRYPIAPKEGYAPYEPIRPADLDFEQRDNVDWSGYYPDGEKAPDYE